MADPIAQRPGELLTYRINLLAQLLNRDAGRLAALHGLRLPEWRVLWHLAAEGPCPPATLVARHAMDKAQVSRALAGLERHGLVEVRPYPADRRRLLPAVTAAGRRLHRRMREAAAARQAGLRDLLAPAELQVLERALGRLTAALRDGAAPPR